MDIRILLVAREAKARSAYHEAIKELGVKVVAVPSLKGLDETVTDLYYHGVMVDMPTKIDALKKDKEFIYSTLRKFPVAHLNLERTTGEIRVFYPGQKTGATLQDFISQECRPSISHKLGYRIRKQIHFNVILSKNIRGENYERTVTVDVSERGCFVFSVKEWKPGDTAWLIIKELSDDTAICGEVRWCIKWGMGMQVPGIGLEFEEIKESQIKEIRDNLWG